eukprot:scaffold7327_cov141-Isochrysis_galbana.AAC.4
MSHDARSADVRCSSHAHVPQIDARPRTRPTLQRCQMPVADDVCRLMINTNVICCEAPGHPTPTPTTSSTPAA